MDGIGRAAWTFQMRLSGPALPSYQPYALGFATSMRGTAAALSHSKQRDRGYTGARIKGPIALTSRTIPIANALASVTVFIHWPGAFSFGLFILLGDFFVNSVD